MLIRPYSPGGGRQQGSTVVPSSSEAVCVGCPDQGEVIGAVAASVGNLSMGGAWRLEGVR